MTHYKVQVIQKYIETYVVEADSKQEAEKVIYEGMHDWLDPSSSKFSDTKVKKIELYEKDLQDSEDSQA